MNKSDQEVLRIVSDLKSQRDEAMAQVAAMRPIVEAVATPRPKNVCCHCTYPYASSHGKERTHTPDCPVLQAQAFVAAHPAVESEKTPDVETR